MCGIFGFKLNRALNESDLNKSLKYLNLLINRGPDNQGYYIDKENGVFLGHTRLSIIDLSKESNQPFIKNNSVIVYNGEVYNYKELKEELNYSNFLTNSDTEVLLSLWQKNKLDGLRKIDGMFAFAIYENKELCIGTDYFGEKPIYYLKNDQGFYFSSEPKVLVEFLNLNVSLNQNEFEEFISLGFIMSPGTGFKKLKVLEQNTLIKIDQNNKIEKSKIFHINEILDKDKKTSLTNQDYRDFKEIFLRSLKRRLISDVPLGLLLSSGLDSTLIATTMVKEFNLKPLTFTASFEDGVDEEPLVKKLTDFLGLDNIKISSSIDDTWKQLDQKTLDLYTVLNDNISGVYTKQICNEAKKYIKVGLTGIGGDELFYGYNNYDFVNKYNFLYSHSKLIKKLADKLIKLIKIKKFLNFNNIIFDNNYHNYIASKNRQIGKLIYRNYLSLNNDPKINESKIINYIRKFDLNHALFSSYLTSADRGSMSRSLELRTPFLSIELLNFSNKFHPIIFKDNKKLFIKNLLKEYLPEEYINKKKIGFNFPLKRFLKNKKINYRKNLPNNFINELNINIEEKNFDKIAFRLLMIEKFENSQ
jgi:asparagine synthase (glutamine-hydrolysing)